MFLTDSTEVRTISNGNIVAVTERPGAVAVILTKLNDAVHTCTWMVQDCSEDGPFVRDCGALAVGFDNGFLCTRGHEHRSDAEYFDADEMAAARNGAFLLPANARAV